MLPGEIRLLMWVLAWINYNLIQKNQISSQMIFLTIHTALHPSYLK